MSNEPAERDPLSGVETTGHEWDGIKELNNPAPRWWLMVLLITIVWAIGYWIAYPVLIKPRGETSGTLGWSSYAQLKQSQSEIEARRAARAKDFAALPLETIRNTPALYQFARAGGQALFKENCAPCHGSGAAGRRGYPNLNDDDWLWGGTLQDVYTTLQHGIRAKDEATRVSDMPRFGADTILKANEIELIANHVQKLSGQSVTMNDADAAQAATLFANNCASCHGANGEGVAGTGAPKFNDSIWLYGGKHEDIVAQIYKPKQGVMPAWGQRLPDSSIKQLAIYIDSLGGVKKAASQ